MSSQKNGKTGDGAAFRAKGNKAFRGVRTGCRWNQIKAEMPLQGSIKMGHSFFTVKC